MEVILRPRVRRRRVRGPLREGEDHPDGFEGSARGLRAVDDRRELRGAPKDTSE